MFKTVYHWLRSGCLLATLLSHQALANTHTELFLVTEHLPPYQVVNENHQISGFAVDIVREVINRTGYEYQLHAYSWLRSYNLTLQKPNHCIFSIARIPIREEHFKWIGQITETNNAVLWGLKKPNAPKITDINQAKNYITAVNKNDVTHLGLLKHGFMENKHLYVLEHTKSLINLLSTRPEIDFIVADDITIGYRAKLAGVDIDALERVYEMKDLPLNFYLACNKQTESSVVNTLKKSLQSVHNDGFYQQTLSQWQDKMVNAKSPEISNN
ncbi:transporter substrate-binding domain-containing protein [Thalassotalea sp. G2M2-11]|uniref:substrate-binding periplasmic protein n=1 Tax=Thalassotalea sp. G2M2-11 TaxID=2787627 RepID=UPI0019CF4D8B|nr:transporter substrate-binding domain-containing protein [Thalassotalea sp. G2M2-11]